jgi:hypothetical protein
MTSFPNGVRLAFFVGLLLPPGTARAVDVPAGKAEAAPVVLGPGSVFRCYAVMSGAVTKQIGDPEKAARRRE